MKFILPILLLFTGLQANAAQGVYFGLNQSKFDVNGSSYDAEMGFELGYRKHFDFDMPFVFRTGAGYHQKNSSIENAVDAELAYLEIPATALFEISQMFSFFGGLNFGLNLTDSCDFADGSSCEILDVESLIYSLALGTQFKFADQHAGEFEYNMGMSDIFKDTELDNTIALRYLYLF